MAASKTTPLASIQALGQAVWLDNISRAMLKTGELKQLIEVDGLEGMTSNPTIFEKAIGHTPDYDPEFRRLVAQGHNAQEIYQSLSVADIQGALDLFRPLYDRTNGEHGYVSLEVSPYLARDTKGTTVEAEKLWHLLNRPNAMIKIPGTPEGVPAIEESLYHGININVTLLFSVEAYEAVAKAYVRALERRAKEGLPVDRIASVASFFISRIDGEVDSRIEAKLKTETDPAKRAQLEHLIGKIAIANAKNAYASFQKIFSGPAWEALKAKGARPQRVLWASVGTKNPKYSDVLYIDELIGPDTVSTMPPATYEAARDHAAARNSLLENIDEARKQVDSLAGLGIDLHDVTNHLLEKGILSFAHSFDELFAGVNAKREKFLAGETVGESAELGANAPAINGAVEDLKKKDAVSRLWKKDPTFWKNDPAHAKIITNSLGWLTVTKTVREKAAELTTFADQIAAEGFTHILLMGMGGSSLCPEVFRRVNIPVAGHPELLVLDSTVPATIRRFESAIDPVKTLFIVASKSGTTTEPSVFYSYFYGLLKNLKGDQAGDNFVAITDPGTLMEANAKRDGFRKIFLNPPDIGGRYSALSFFGMVPAALMGLDVTTLLDRADVAIATCSPATPIEKNPGATLGATLGTFALAGRDKVTLVNPAPLEALGLWIEQLIAESTGKEGKGILPVAGEALGSPAVYGSDRVFVQIRTADGDDSAVDAALSELANAGHPVLTHVLTDTMDLGAEFFRWEVAAAIAGERLGINPFDQPNVQESKDNTKALLAEFEQEGKFSEPAKIAEFEGLTLSADPWNTAQIAKSTGGGRDQFVAALKAHLARVKPGDYVAITQYFDEREKRDITIDAIRITLRDLLKVATTTGYGPRFLHSTGQLHKGGSDSGVFVQLTADDGLDVPIPGERFGFATLVKAQALGDYQSLASRHRRAIRIHLGADVDRALGTLRSLLADALASK